MGVIKQQKNWSNTALKCLLETYIDEVNKVGRNGGSMYKNYWVRLGKTLKEQFGMDVNQKQMNFFFFDNLKAKYVGWVYLRNKTGNLYNPQTNMFTLTDEEWEAFGKGHKMAAYLKTHPLPFPDLCVPLYEMAASNGDNQWTSTQESGASTFNECVRSLQIEDNTFVDLEDEDGDSRAQGFQANDNIPTNQEGPSSSNAPSVDERRPKKRAKTPITLDELAMDMQQALRHIAKSKEGPTAEQYYEKLKLVGLETMDPLFLAAFNIFGLSTQMREAWMAFPLDPGVLKEWIKLMGATFGIFK